ncbi:MULTISPECIES: adenylyl-sulfate kinase [unclassified Anabaena]|nr:MULTISPECIES: adenylyl-sulfate kinase [unclassified Anabaena]
MTVWLTGLSGSGRTTISSKVAMEWRSHGYKFE